MLCTASGHSSLSTPLSKHNVYVQQSPAQPSHQLQYLRHQVAAVAELLQEAGVARQRLRNVGESDAGIIDNLGILRD